MPPCYPVVPGIMGALRVGGPELIAAIVLVAMASFCAGVLVMGRRS